MRGERIEVAKCIVACRMQVKGGREALVFLLHRDNQPLGAAHGGQGQAGIKVTCPSVRSVSHHSFGGDSKGAEAVIQLGELLMILDLHRRGLSITAIAPAHRPRSEDDPQIHRTLPRAAGLWAATGRPAHQDRALSRLSARARHSLSGFERGAADARDQGARLQRRLYGG